MKIFNFLALFLTPVFLTLASVSHATQYQYCWFNEDDIRECGNYVPPEFAQKGYWVIDMQGNVIKEVAAKPTEEEIAQEKALKAQREAEEARRKLEAEKDQEVLDLFSSVDNIEYERQSRLDGIEATIEIINARIDRSARNLDEMKNNLEESYDNEAVTEKQRERLKSNIAREAQNLKSLRQSLQEKEAEKGEVNEKFDAYLERFLKIQARLQKKNSPQQSQDNP